ncbi:MAG: hypothetical protein O9327_02255 [Polaromonas sp.]|nr:hypothetical protein [Polaromonas sp.]
MTDATGPQVAAPDLAYEVQVSDCGRTLWVHAADGSTVGRFSTVFGMDVHTAVTQQLAGAPQCLKCTHTRPNRADWETFRSLMREHYGVGIAANVIAIQSLLP